MYIKGLQVNYADAEIIWAAECVCVGGRGGRLIFSAKMRVLGTLATLTQLLTQQFLRRSLVLQTD